MIVLKANINNVELKTEFDFDNKHTKLVKDVLDCIKRKKIKVPDSKRKWKPPWLKNYKPGKLLNTNKIIYNRLKTWPAPQNGEELIKDWGNDFNTNS
jgi:hypothetical protein